ncbi:MAG: alpha/beta hydrolase [Oscillospiraceae bacterium]|nr:alpha/beta hydrolase [Oscillospiraceae bacterium]
MKKLFVLFLSANLLIWGACSQPIIPEPAELIQGETPVLTTEPPPAEQRESDLNVIYKTSDGQELYFDIFFPTVQKYEKTPLLAAFHGGGWLAGNKMQIMRLYSPLAEILREAGYAVAAVEYRLAAGGVVFPAPFIDSADFIRYIKENADTYNIDPENIGVLGYSAGAHLAMLTSYAAADLDIRYCISFAGPAKLYGEDAASVPPMTMFLLENLFGGRYPENEELYKSGSPYFYLSGAEHKKTPLLLLHDRTDDVVPFVQSEVMLDKTAELGIESELLEIRGVGHDIEFISGRMNEPSEEEAMRVILNFIYKFYKNY